jgi:hypothetical protein
MVVNQMFRRSGLALHDVSGQMDGAAYSLKRAAAADVAGQGGIDIGVGRMRILVEQRGGVHELSRHTITALRHIQGDPGLLHRMTEIGREAFNGGDLFPSSASHRRNTGTHRDTIEVDGTGTALGDATAVLGSGESEIFPQYPEERRIGIDFHGKILAVDLYCYHVSTSWIY